MTIFNILGLSVRKGTPPEKTDDSFSTGSHSLLCAPAGSGENKGRDPHVWIMHRPDRLHSPSRPLPAMRHWREDCNKPECSDGFPRTATSVELHFWHSLSPA